jgi:hypothetical protein
MKCAPLTADSLNSTPLLARIAIGIPDYAQTADGCCAAVKGALVVKLAAVNDPRMTSWTS